MLCNMALLVLAVMLRLQPARPGPSLPTVRLPEPELLAGVAPCKCVDIRQCSAMLGLLRRVSASRDSDSAELNHLRRSTCGFHGFVPFVCCPGESSLESRINTIGHGASQTIHKKSYHPDYAYDYSEHSHGHHHSFVPNLSPYHHTDSKTDFHLHDHSGPFPFDDSSRNGDQEEDFPYGYEDEDLVEDGDDEEDENIHSKEILNVPSKTHFSNHPPHVHGHSHDLPDISISSKDESLEEKDPLKYTPTSRRATQSTTKPTRCRPSTGKIPVDVSVFSRGGGKELGDLQMPCEPVEETTSPTVSVDNSTEILLEIQRILDSPGARLLPGDQCGVTVDERIVGGKEAELGAFPWIARIGYIRNGSSTRGAFLYRCGGSLLNERYILTAAHCVTKLPGGLELATIRLGEHDERSDPDCKSPAQAVCADPVQDFRPEVVIVHPMYDSPKYSNDLALVRLDRPARLSTYVSPICLPLGELAMKNYTGLKATVAGWGATHIGLTSSSPVLQWVRLGVVESTRCADAYERAEVQINAWKQLCAGGERMADSCDGDSGGPLMRPEQPNSDSLPRYFLVGVVSFGAKICGTENMPGVYTRVAAYLRWIVDELRP